MSLKFYLIVILVCSVNCYTSRSFWVHNSAKLSRSFLFQSLAGRSVNIGDIIVAEIDDIGGSLQNPVIKFISNDFVEKKDIFMRANTLSTAQRLALQQGAIMEVFVSKIDGEKVEVKLSKNNSRDNLRNPTSIVETLDDFDYRSIGDYDKTRNLSSSPSKEITSTQQQISNDLSEMNTNTCQVSDFTIGSWSND